MTEEQDAQSGASDSGEGEQSEIAAAASNIGKEVTETFAELKGGERLAALGAVLVLAAWLIFDLLINDYGVGSTSYGLAILIVGAAYIQHQRGGVKAVPYRSLLFVAAGILGVIGANEIIEEALRNNIFDARGGTVFGAIVYYVGSIMSGVGAIQLRGK